MAARGRSARSSCRCRRARRSPSPTRGCVSPGTIASCPRSTRRSRSSSAPAPSTTATIASTWSRRSRASSSIGATASTCAATSRCPSSVGATIELAGAARRRRRRPLRRAPRAVHRSAQSRRLLPRHLSRSSGAGDRPRPRAARHRQDGRRRRLVRQLRRHLLHLLATTPCSTRSKAIRASSSTTARRRRRRAPAREEWGGGGDYWGGRNMTLPFAGHPVGAPSARAGQGRGRPASIPRTASCSPT